MKTLLSIFLAISTFFSNLTGTLTSETYLDSVPAMSDSYTLPREPSAVWNSSGEPIAHADVDYADMEYVHYEKETFTVLTDALRDAAWEGDIDRMCFLSEALYCEYSYVDTLYVLSSLRHNADIYNGYWAKEYTYMSALISDVSEDLYNAVSYALSTSCGAELSDFLGEIATAYYSAGESHFDEDRDEAEDYDERILELEDEYYALSDTVDTLVYGGMTLEQFYAGGGELDYDTYMDMYYGFQQKLYEVFSPTYIELINLRNQQAQAAGYDSYTDYAYELIYYRAYTPEDAQAFCDAVKPLAREFYENIYYSDFAYDAADFFPSSGGEELMAALGQYLPQIDAALAEPWEYLSSHGLYDLQNASTGRFDGGYTVTLPSYNSAFIYNTQDGSSYDFITLTHEFGHFCNFYYNPLPNMILWVDDLDLSEIHSNGLQALFTAFYDVIYGEESCKAEYTCLDSLVQNVITGCLYDEFQRRVYDSAEPLTAEELNRVFTALCGEYGMYGIYDEPLSWDASWVYISHNFRSPLYYISYAVSGLAALQIWDLAQTDFAAAADVYMDILRHGAYAQTYFEVLADCGFTSFTAEGAAEAVCRPAFDRLEALAYD